MFSSIGTIKGFECEKMKMHLLIQFFFIILKRNETSTFFFNFKFFYNYKLSTADKRQNANLKYI